MNASPWLRATDGGVTVAIYAQPNAKRAGIVGIHGEALKIKVASPAVDGAANASLLEFIAALVGVKSRDVTLVRGAANRQKVIEIRGISLAHARTSLAPAGRE